MGECKFGFLNQKSFFFQIFQWVSLIYLLTVPRNNRIKTNMGDECKQACKHMKTSLHCWASCGELVLKKLLKEILSKPEIKAEDIRIFRQEFCIVRDQHFDAVFFIPVKSGFFPEERNVITDSHKELYYVQILFLKGCFILTLLRCTIIVSKHRMKLYEYRET